MQEIYSILDLRINSVPSENVFEYYAKILEEHQIRKMTIFVLRTDLKQEKQNIGDWYRITDIFRNHHIELEYYISDVLEARQSIFRSTYDRRINSCNNSRYVFVDLPYALSFVDRFYDYLMALMQLNFIPVLINVDMHRYLYLDQHLLKSLVDMGCVICMNYANIDTNNPGPKFDALVDLNAKGLCHMMMGSFLVDPMLMKRVSSLMSGSFTSYIMNIEMSDNIRCMIANREMIGISKTMNIIEHPSIDSEIADARWSR